MREGVPIKVPREGTQSPEPQEPISEQQHIDNSPTKKLETGITPFSYTMSNDAFELPNWASAMQKQITQHDNLFGIIKQQQDQLTQQQAQLAEQQRNSAQQQALLTELLATIRDLQATVRDLKASTPTSAPATSAAPVNTEVPTPAQQPAPQTKAAPAAPSLKGTEASIWSNIRKDAPAIFQRQDKGQRPTRPAQRRPDPARFFSAPPQERSQYTMTFLSVRHRTSQREVRQTLRAAKINTARILDITLPASGVVGLLTHRDFVDSLKLTLAEAKIDTVDFDPTAPQVVGDPKYSALSEDQKTRVARHLHNATCLRVLAGMPAHIRRSVAHDYFVKNYITAGQYEYQLNKVTKEQVNDTLNPVTLAELIESFSSPEEKDEEMRSHHSTSTVTSKESSSHSQ